MAGQVVVASQGKASIGCDWLARLWSLARAKHRLDVIVGQVVVASPGEAYAVLEKGWRSRTVAETTMNRESSRSHAVFTFNIESKVAI